MAGRSEGWSSAAHGDRCWRVVLAVAAAVAVAVGCVRWPSGNVCHVGGWPERPGGGGGDSKRSSARFLLQARDGRTTGPRLSSPSPSENSVLGGKQMVRVTTDARMCQAASALTVLFPTRVRRPPAKKLSTLESILSPAFRIFRSYCTTA